MQITLTDSYSFRVFIVFVYLICAVVVYVLLCIWSLALSSACK
jgi:hypothetical protein